MHGDDPLGPGTDVESTLVTRPSGVEDLPPDLPPLDVAGLMPPALGTDRYTGFVNIARGGQGDVFRALDQKLSRAVALKVLRPDRQGSAEALRREVALLVRLQHPGVVPVHDRGETADGRPWFAMQLVSGDELTRVIERMRAGHRRWTPRRVVDLLARVAAAVGHAHQRAVVHCDLKPDNIMVGALGEVWVMDWGIARDVQAPVPPRVGDRPAAAPGTPGYMAPERFEGAPLDPRMDVYGLGAILYRILTGRRPKLLLGPAGGWPVSWPDGSEVSAELVALAVAACDIDPTRRPPDGAAFAQALTDWLDGARRRDEARALLADADGLRSRWRALRGEARDLGRRAARALAEVGPLATAEAKRPGRILEDEAEERAAAAELVELELVGAVQAALTRAPGLAGAGSLLAEHYRDVLLDAEAVRDAAGARRAAALVRRHGDAGHIAWLDGPGRVSLTTDPPGARVTLSPYVERQRRLVPGPGRFFEHTPLIDVSIAPGSYVALVEAPGYAPARLPLRVERGSHWRNAPPDGEPRPLRLLPVDGLEPDGVYVPAGWCVLGGDPAALDGLRRRRMWIDGFVIDRTSVTHGAWLAFLADVAARHGHEALDGLLPRARDGARTTMGPVALAGDGELALGLDDDGEPIDPDTPVALVDHAAAVRYARWRAARTGRPWRLPHDLEWEKAARGVDGRLWPWGDHFDPTLTVTAESFAGRPHSRPVGSVPADESPFGVRDMAGFVRNWCGSDYAPDGPDGEHLILAPARGPLRMVRGGAWAATADACRPAGRFANRPDQRFRTIGVRLVRAIGP